MTGSKYLLDSSIIIDVLGNNDREVTKRVESLETFNINTIVLGELHVGVNRVRDKEKHLWMLHRFLKTATIINIFMYLLQKYMVR
jgi:predicted nucleic acid-binding protein